MSKCMLQENRYRRDCIQRKGYSSKKGIASE